MIKINLLPSHILESRRVKALLRWIILGLLVIVGALCGYVWGPAPFCLGPQQKVAQERLNEANTAWSAVETTKAEGARIAGQYAETSQWVAWVEEADKKPGQWIAWYNLLRKYIPADVVVTAFPSPSTSLSFTGYTSDFKAACRWYLNMLRCEMLDGPADSVRFSTNTLGWPAQEPAAENPRMRQPVTISLPISGRYLTMLEQPFPPTSAGVSGGRGGARSAGGGRMGAGRGGGRGGARGGMGSRRGG
jgi:Tfp pilus assembly protein PilN